MELQLYDNVAIMFDDISRNRCFQWAQDNEFGVLIFRSESCTKFYSIDEHIISDNLKLILLEIDKSYNWIAVASRPMSGLEISTATRDLIGREPTFKIYDFITCNNPLGSLCIVLIL